MSRRGNLPLQGNLGFFLHAGSAILGAHVAIRSVYLNNTTMNTRFVTLPELRGYRKPSKVGYGNHDLGKFPKFADRVIVKDPPRIPLACPSSAGTKS
jgi:hypothetical protein